MWSDPTVLINPTTKRLIAEFSRQIRTANRSRVSRILPLRQPLSVRDILTVAQGFKVGHAGRTVRTHRYPSYSTGLWYAWATDRRGDKHVIIQASEVSARTDGARIGPFPKPTVDKFVRLRLTWLLMYRHLENYRQPNWTAWNSEERTFRMKIRAKLEDHARWLIFADWLDEHDRAEDARIIRLFLLPAT